MALQDKDILITPARGSTAEPKIEFKGASATLGPQTVSLNVYPTNNGTVSFEGSAGQLFSITNELSGTIYSVNDISGIPSLEVLDTGLVKVAQYSGNVLIGTGTSDGSKLQVAGTMSISSTSDAQLYLKSTDTWTGIVFDDNNQNVGNIWHHGVTDTFAIGGGGSTVANKKLHIHGGVTIGSGYGGTNSGVNGLNVEGAIQQAGNQVLHATNFNTYAPTLTGTGASGSWGISVTGTAANVTGTVAVANGGTGATTLTGLVKGNGTGAMTAAVAGTDFVAPAALASYAPLASPTFTGTVSGITKTMVGLSNVDNTSDATKPVSTLQAASIATKEPIITAGTTSQFWRGDKTWQDFATDVRTAVLTGLSTATSTVVDAADTVLVALGKLQAQVTGKVSKTGDTMTGPLNIDQFPSTGDNPRSTFSHSKFEYSGGSPFSTTVYTVDLFNKPSAPVPAGRYLMLPRFETTNGAILNGGITADTANITIGTDQIFKDTTGKVAFGSTSTGYGKVSSWSNFGVQGTQNFMAHSGNGSNGRLSGYSFFSTFMNLPGDINARRSADIWSGYNGGAWGAEYLAFGVGGATDAGNVTTERMRIDGNGNVSIGSSSSGGYKFSVTAGAGLKSLRTTTDASASYHYADGAYYAGTSTASSIVLVTNNTGRVRVAADGTTTFESAAFGYGAGAGGTGTTVWNSSISKFEVTIPKPSGKITHSVSGLANGGKQAIKFNCTAFGIDSLLIANIAWGVEPADYNIWCATGASGTAAIVIENVSGVTKTETIYIHFAVIRGATT